MQMWRDTEFLQVIPVQNMYVKLLYRGEYSDGDEEDIPLLNPEGDYDERRLEVKPVICLALTQDKDDGTKSLHPIIFTEYLDFAEQSNVSVEDLFYKIE